MATPSTAQRWLRGSIASWVRLAVALLAQIAVTPVMLTFWSAERYGVWLSLQAAVALIKIPGAAHQDYVGFELMRELQRDRVCFGRTLASGLRVGVLYGYFELIIAGLLALGSWFLFSGKLSNEPEVIPAFFLLMVGSSLVWNWAGLWVRVANATGHYDRSAWWGVADVIMRLSIPLLVLPLGAGLLGASAAFAVGALLLHTATVRHLKRLCIIDLPAQQEPEWRLGWANWAKAQALALKGLLEMSRQQGIRIILAPLAGAAQVAAFSTMRTGANVVVQGLGTITNPMMPELMRFLHKRDQARSEAALCSVWLVVLVIMAPGMLVVQALAPYLFMWWTRDKIDFDPLLFAMLSAGVLILACAQPAVAVVRGNNLLRVQMLLSTISAVLVIGLMFVLVPIIGIRGAALALLVAEIVSAFCFARAARDWMLINGLAWPNKPFGWVLGGVGIATVGSVLIVYFSESALFVVLIGFILIGFILWGYWRTLPVIARQRATNLIVDKLPARVRPRMHSVFKIN